MSSLTAPTGLLIGGEWQQTQKRLQVIDPATFTVLAADDRKISRVRVQLPAGRRAAK